VNASVLDPPDPTDAIWVFPSQLLTVEVLQRPVESAQYASLAFTARLAEVGGVASMGSVGDALGNAACESFFATLKLELLADGRTFTTRAGARTAVFDWIECWYNPRRRHSTLAPLEYEQALSSANQPHREEVASTKP
jgi:hypothetical protein